MYYYYDYLVFNFVVNRKWPSLCATLFVLGMKLGLNAHLLFYFFLRLARAQQKRLVTNTEHNRTTEAVHAHIEFDSPKIGNGFFIFFG